MRLYSLLEGAQKKDKQSTADILSHFYPTIKKLGNGLHYEEAETDVIIVFLELINSMDIEKFYKADDEQISSYIHKHLRNRSFNLFRRYKAKYTPYTQINYDILSDPNTPDLDNKLLISMLLKSLVPLQREVIIRKYIYGFSDSETAKQLGVTRQAINKAKNRALNNLRKILTSDGGEEIGRTDNRISIQSRNMDSSNGSSNILYFKKSRKKGFTSRRKRNKISKHNS